NGTQATQFLRSFSGSVKEAAALEATTYFVLGSRTTERAVTVDGILFLIVSDPQNGDQLWRIFDNTEQYVAQLVFNAGAGNQLDSLTVVRNAVYFRQNAQQLMVVGAS